ncbi:hypothetical protein ACIHFE_25735 [Streptomyces sp. NPDC052396]|uniref:hypothetical protein n=1 Tax=Streptomyces sp. NPDC052396 TaxID=3365689 RepID=UPI0037D4AA89
MFLDVGPRKAAAPAPVVLLFGPDRLPGRVRERLAADPLGLREPGVDGSTVSSDAPSNAPAPPRGSASLAAGGPPPFDLDAA